MTDTELLKRHLQGDVTAFADLVHRHANWVWGSALRQTGEEALAEDITQAAFLLLARKAGSLRAHSSLHAWLFRVVHYLAKDARKIAARRRHHETKVAAMKSEQSPETPNWDALQTILDESVAQLREVDRQAILLRFYEGLSLSQVGAMLHLSEEAATKRVSRAVARLRDILHQQGLASSTDVQSLLASGMTCAAPAALVAQIAAGGPSATTIALAAKASKLLFTAKLKVTAAVVAATLATAGVTTGIVLTTTRATPPAPPAVVAAPLPAAPAHAPEPDVQPPPIREGKQTIAVNRTTLILPQQAVDELLAASQAVTPSPGIQTRIGDSKTLRPLLRNLLPQAADTPRLDWHTRYSPSGFGLLGGPPLTIQIGQPSHIVDISSSVTVSPGAITQIAGGFTLGGTGSPPQPYSFAPTTLRPGQLVLQVIPLNSDLNLVFAYEALPIDVADLDPLTQMTDATAWFNKPHAEQLRLARAGTVWESLVPKDRNATAGTKAIRLPGGAEIWVHSVSDAAIHPLACWTADGQPAEVHGTGKPTASIRINDPNQPPHNLSSADAYEGWYLIQLTRRTDRGYACSVGYGDGKYKTVASLQPSKGAKATFGNCTIEIEDIHEHGIGGFRITGEIPSDTDIDVMAIRKDGSFAWNNYRYDLLAEGQKFAIATAFSYDIESDQIDHLEIRTRPVKWVTLEGLATRPAIPLPTGLEPVVDRDAARSQQLAAATPPDRKAFLDRVQCIRFWGTRSGAIPTDSWTWRDGRYRREEWPGHAHTLELGDGVTVWKYDFATGKWTESWQTGSQMVEFRPLIQQIGGMESVLTLGETLGTEDVHGVPCTIRAARMESTQVKVWLDSRGLVRRWDAIAPNASSLLFDYDPAGADRVWTPPTGAAAKNARYEPTAEAYLAKALPTDTSLTTLAAAGRIFRILSVKTIREDLAVLCTSTDLTPPARAHRDQTGDKWQATQLNAIAPGDVAWTPRAIARLHMPYREITWWALAKGSRCEETAADLLVRFGDPSPSTSWKIECWLDTQPNPARLHRTSVSLEQADPADLDTYLKEVFTLIEGYRAAVGEAGKDDFITTGGTWEKFRETATKAIDGRESISSSGR